MGSDWLQNLADQVKWEKELADQDGQTSDAEVRQLKRRGSMPNKITAEVERVGDEVHFVVGNGANPVTYKMSASLAKSIGEELFKQGCNAQGAAGAA